MKTPIRGAARGGLVVAVAMTAILLAACGSAGSAAGPAYGGTDGAQGQNGGMPAASRAPVAQGEEPSKGSNRGQACVPRADGIATLVFQVVEKT